MNCSTDTSRGTLTENIRTTQFICRVKDGLEGNICESGGRAGGSGGGNSQLHESIVAQMFCLSRQKVNIIRTDRRSNRSNRSDRSNTSNRFERSSKCRRRINCMVACATFTARRDIQRASQPARCCADGRVLKVSGIGGKPKTMVEGPVAGPGRTRPYVCRKKKPGYGEQRQGGRGGRWLREGKI